LCIDTSEVPGSEICPDIYEVCSASTSSFSSRQHEDELQNELTSKLIIKSEHKCSNVEETQSNASYEDDIQIEGKFIIGIILSRRLSYNHIYICYIYIAGCTECPLYSLNKYS
jgi:hypothetical protein